MFLNITDNKFINIYIYKFTDNIITYLATGSNKCHAAKTALYGSSIICCI